MSRFISFACSSLIVTACFADGLASGKTASEKTIRAIAKKNQLKACPWICPEPNRSEEEDGDENQPRQGEPLAENKLDPAYNAPANIKLSNEWESDAFYLQGSYLYWHASQCGMDLAHSFIATSATTGIPQTFPTIVSQPFHYQSGFKASLGMESDNWIIDASYLWIRQHTELSAAAPSANPSVGTGVWLVEGWYIQTPSLGVVASRIDSSWHLAMDVGDFVLGRSFYLGPNLSASPYGGLRGALIRQNLRLSAQEVVVTAAPTSPVVSHNGSKAWAVGPKIGSDIFYLLGCGFRLDTHFAGSVLYERYRRATHREDGTQTSDLVQDLKLQRRNVTVLAPVLEMGLGFSWGRYLGSSAHIDLLFSYDFQVWWQQNFMRQQLNSYATGSGYLGELFLHGGTASLKLAF